MRIKKVSQATLVAGEVIQENGTPSTTNVYSSVAIDNKFDNLKEEVIYDNAEGSTANITLSDAISNYDYIEIFAKYGPSYCTSQKVYVGKRNITTYFNLTASMINQTVSTGYIAATNYTMVGTSITPDYYGEITLLSNSFSNNNRMYITRVVGYTIVSENHTINEPSPNPSQGGSN